MKIAYVRTGGKGGVQTNAYALRTGGGGQKLANFCVRTLWMAPKPLWCIIRTPDRSFHTGIGMSLNEGSFTCRFMNIIFTLSTCSLSIIIR